MMDSYAMCNPLPRILVLPVILTALVAARGVLAQAAPGDPCGPTMFGYHLGNYLPNGYDNGNPGSATGQGVFHIHLGSPIPLLDGSLGGTAAGYLGSADYSSNILQPGGGPFLPPGSGIIGTFEGYPGGGGGGGGGPGGGPGDPGGGGPGGLGGGGGGFFDLGSLMFADASVQYGPNPTVSGSVMQYAATLPGEADVYTHEGSGDQIYEFIDAQGDPTGVSEIRHVDGTVIVLESYASPDPEVRTYRVKHIIDPFDNRVTYEYGAGEGGLGSGLLDRIHYPNGITEVWNWDPVWAQSSTYTGIEVTYLSAHPGINVADHTWAMVFEPTSEGNFPFAGGRLFRVYHPKSEYLQTPASGSLYDLTTTDAFVVYEFQANGQDPYHLVTDIYHARATTIDPDDPLPNRVQTLQVTYELTGTLNPQYRVKEQTLSQHPGATTTFAYEFHAGQTTDLVQFIDETSPVGTVTRTELDLEGRPVKITITPDSNSPLGVPRFLEQVPPSKGPDGEEPFSSVPWSSEPVSLTWQFEYGGCSVCAKPTRILDPLLRETLFSYWPTGLIDTITIPNPAYPADPGEPAEPEFVEYKYTWENGVPAGEYSGYQLLSLQTPDGTWTNSNTFHGRQNPEYGLRLVQVTTTSPSVGLEGGGSMVTGSATTFRTSGPPALPDIQQKLVGQVDRLIDSDGIQTFLEYDADSGFLERVDRNDGGGTEEVATGYDVDPWGRVTSLTRNLGSSLANVVDVDSTTSGQPLGISTSIDGVNIAEKTLRDRWGNVAVILRTNRNASGGEPEAHGGMTEQARPEVRTEFHWVVDRLVRKYEDRRPLDRDAATPISDNEDALMLQTDYAYRADGLIDLVVKPNGAVLNYQHDGYGTLYRVTESSSQENLSRGYYYYNGALELIAVFEGSTAEPLWTTYERNGAGVVTEIVEPTAGTAPPGYTGSLGGAKHEFKYDAMGRVTKKQTLDGMTELANTKYLYDELGRLRKKTDAVLGGGPTGSGDHETSIRYTPGRGTQIDWVKRTPDRTMEYDYDGAGRVSTLRIGTGPNPDAKTYSYHNNTDFISKISSTLFDNSPAAQTLQTYVTEYDLDPLGRVKQIREKGKGGTQTALTHNFTYYTLGFTETYTDPLGKLTKYLPDALGRLAESVEVAGSEDIKNSSVFVDWTGVDDRSRVERYDGRGRTTVTHFDFAARPFIIQKPGAGETEPTPAVPYKPLSVLLAYDAASRLTNKYAATFPDEFGQDRGVETRFHYDGPGRLIVRETPNGHAEVSSVATRDVYQRDALGRITDMISLAGDITIPSATVHIQFLEDSIGRVHQERYLYAYAPGNITEIVSGYNGADLFRSSLTYSDNTGLPSELSLDFTPDSIGRLSEMKWAQPGEAETLLAKYSHMGSRTSQRQLEYGSATGITDFSFDSYGRLQSIVDMVGPTQISGFQYEYDAAGNLKKEFYAKQGGGFGDRFLYDGFNRLLDGWLGLDSTSMNANDEEFENMISQETVQFVERLTYNLDDANNRSSVDSEDGSTGIVTTEPYTTQEAWNLQGPSNRYFDVNQVPLTHDNRGNVVYDGRYAYSYDYLNRLSEVYEVSWGASASSSGPESQSATVASSPVYLDDAAVLRKAQEEILLKAGGIDQILKRHGEPRFRRRLSAPIRLGGNRDDEDSAEEEVGFEDPTLTLKAVYIHDGFNRRFLRAIIGYQIYLSAYDGWQEVEELVPTGAAPAVATPIKQFVWGDRLDEQVAYREMDTGGVWSTYFVHNGGQDSVVRIVDESGSIVQIKEYDPYGRETNWSFGGGTSNPYSWKGHRLDPETGLIYMRNRYYSPFLGRFLTHDLLGMWYDPINLGNGYAYGANSPQNFLDPMGLQGTGTNLPWQDRLGEIRREMREEQAKISEFQQSWEQSRLDYLASFGFNPDEVDLYAETDDPLHDMVMRGKPFGLDPLFYGEGLGSLAPGVGQAMDAAVALDGDAPWWARLLAGVSLVADSCFGSLLPNFGAFYRSSDELLYGGAFLRTSKEGPRLHFPEGPDKRPIIPNRGDLKEMPSDQLLEFGEMTEISLATRGREMSRLGDSGGHGRQIGDERRLLNGIRDELRNRGVIQ